MSFLCAVSRVFNDVNIFFFTENSNVQVYFFWSLYSMYILLCICKYYFHFVFSVFCNFMIYLNVWEKYITIVKVGRLTLHSIFLYYKWHILRKVQHYEVMVLYIVSIVVSFISRLPQIPHQLVYRWWSILMFKLFR